jgi:hypothetical protein
MKEAEAKEHGFRQIELEDAMRRLFDAGKIRLHNHGRPSRPHYRIVIP